jgi:hypothetical protein
MAVTITATQFPFEGVTQRVMGNVKTASFVCCILPSVLENVTKKPELFSFFK